MAWWSFGCWNYRWSLKRGWYARTHALRRSSQGRISSAYGYFRKWFSNGSWCAWIGHCSDCTATARYKRWHNNETFTFFRHKRRILVQSAKCLWSVCHCSDQERWACEYHSAQISSWWDKVIQSVMKAYASLVPDLWATRRLFRPYWSDTYCDKISFGVVAPLGERLNGMQKIISSILLGFTWDILIKSCFRLSLKRLLLLT